MPAWTTSVSESAKVGVPSHLCVHLPLQLRACRSCRPHRRRSVVSQERGLQRVVRSRSKVARSCGRQSCRWELVSGVGCPSAQVCKCTHPLVPYTVLVLVLSLEQPAAKLQVEELYGQKYFTDQNAGSGRRRNYLLFHEGASRSALGHGLGG